MNVLGGFIFLVVLGSTAYLAQYIYKRYRVYKTPAVAQPSPDQDSDSDAPKGKLCEFEGEDLFEKKVFKKIDNSLVTTNPKGMQCSECVDYIYREGPTECYEFEYTNKDNEVIGVCLAKTVASKCTY